MKILFAAAEVAPFSKAGGLADVVGSLPKELEKDAQIAIFTPLHGCIDKDKYNIKELENSTMWLTFGNQPQKFSLFTTKLPNTDINVFFIKNDWYFSCFKDVYPKNLDPRYEHERYISFSLAVMEYAKAMNFKPDVIHANDWHTAMIPMYLHSNYKFDDFYSNTKCVFEIHNLAYQGIWFEDVIDFANMRKDIVYNQWGCEHYNRVNWMKGAINYSDRVVTVSPTYSREILGGEYGENMDYTLRGIQYKLKGILNGIDYTVFNPKTDKALVANYDLTNFEKAKEENKKEVCKFFGLKYNPERPLIALISRLVGQKGIDLIRDMQDELQKLDADFVFLGSGDKNYENLFIWLSNNTSNIRTFVGYDGKLANQIYAGSDFFLMPSMFEPCGLSQLIAMRYGTVPIVRETGGLIDTVEPYNEFENNGTGFSFANYNGEELASTIKYAYDVFCNHKRMWNNIIRRDMTFDFSWKASVQKYEELYDSLL